MGTWGARPSLRSAGVCRQEIGERLAALNGVEAENLRLQQQVPDPRLTFVRSRMPRGRGRSWTKALTRLRSVNSPPPGGGGG